MNLWIILLIVSVCFLLLEMFTPTLFFINFAIAAAICALLSFLGYSYTVLVFAFLIISIITIGFVRPLLLKKMTGKTVTGYLEEYRANKSYSLVQSGQYSMAQIADMVGFSNASRFARAFRRQFGCNPGEYASLEHTQEAPFIRPDRHPL